MSAAYKRRRFKERTPRNPYWDYSSRGAYFITICTKNRKAYFGRFDNGVFHATQVGKIAIEEWKKTPEIRNDMNIELDEYCLMPDHFHAIIIFGNNESKAIHRVPNKFGPQSKNLASVIRGFKSAVKIFAIKNNIDFSWQPRYHDRIIRNKKELENTRRYIRGNPGEMQ